jgi:hypothetical protein
LLAAIALARLLGIKPMGREGPRADDDDDDDDDDADDDDATAAVDDGADAKGPRADRDDGGTVEENEMTVFAAEAAATEAADDFSNNSYTIQSNDCQKRT